MTGSTKDLEVIYFTNNVLLTTEPKVLILITSNPTNWHTSEALQSTIHPGSPFHKIHFNIVPPSDLGL